MGTSKVILLQIIAFPIGRCKEMAVLPHKYYISKYINFESIALIMKKFRLICEIVHNDAK